MTRILLWLFSLILMVYLPLLITDGLGPVHALRADPLKSLSRSRLAYHTILVELSHSVSTLDRYNPVTEQPVEVYSWRDSDGQLHFSDKRQASGSSVKSEITSVKNQPTGRLAFSQTWVLGFMALVWLLMTLIIHFGIILLQKGLSSSTFSKLRRRPSQFDQPPRVKVWRDVDVESSAPHHILGINEYASVDEIKRAYRHTIKQYHPDRVATMGEEIQALAERKAAAINQAYEQMMKKNG